MNSAIMQMDHLEEYHKLFTLLHLFLPDSYWTRTGTNFMLADHHTNFVSQS